MTGLEAWGRFVHRRRGLALVFSLLLVAGCLALFPFAGEPLKPGTPNPRTESGQGALLIEDQVPAAKDDTLVIVLSHPPRSWPDSDFQQEVAAVQGRLQGLERVGGVLSPTDGPGLVSHDGAYVLLVATLEPGVDAYAAYEDVQDALAASPLESLVTGEVAVDHAMGSLVGQDLARAEMVSLPLALIVLVVVFGAVVAALLPLAVGALSVVCGIAVALAAANFIDVPDYAIQIVSLIGLGVAIDYSLFIVKRFREELESGAAREDALAAATGHAGHAVLFSGLTVAASLGGLAFFHGTELAGVGVAVFAVVLLAVVQAMLLLPALLAYLGPRVNRLRLPRRRHRTSTWSRIADRTMRRPVLHLVVASAILLPMALPLATLQVGGFSIQQLPESEEARSGFDTLQREFPGQGAAEVPVVLHWPPDAPWRQRLETVARFAEASRELPGAGEVVSIVSWNPAWSVQEHVDALDAPRSEWPHAAQRMAHTHLGQDIAVVSVHTDAPEDGPAAKRLVRELRATPAPGAQVHVTGVTATNLDKADLIQARAPLALAAIAAATLALIGIQTRSLVLPFKALLMNTLSISAAFGAMVLVFQHGWGSTLLDFTPGPLVLDSLVIMACIMFGLSMDYEVLLMGRIREEYHRTGDNATAVRDGLARTGLVITGAAFIMVCVFGAFGLVRLAFIKMIGVGLAFAVLLDATLVRALLVPSLMRLMGHWNWWPARASPALPARPDPPRPARQGVRPRFEDPDVQAWFESARRQRSPPRRR